MTRLPVNIVIGGVLAMLVLGLAALSLVCVTAMQTLGMAFWLRWREPGQVAAVWAARRRAV